jgi:hypothetical protein
MADKNPPWNAGAPTAKDILTEPGEQLFEIILVAALEDWLPTRAKTHRILVVTPLYTPGCYTPNGYLVISESKAVSGFRYLENPTPVAVRNVESIRVTRHYSGPGGEGAGHGSGLLPTQGQGGRGGKPTLYYVHHPGTNKYLKLRVDTVEGTDIFQWVDGINEATPFTDYYEAARMSSDSKIHSARVETR